MSVLEREEILMRVGGRLYENIFSYFFCSGNNYRFLLFSKVITIHRIIDSNSNWDVFFDF